MASECPQALSCVSPSAVFSAAAAEGSRSMSLIHAICLCDGHPQPQQSPPALVDLARVQVKTGILDAEIALPRLMPAGQCCINGAHSSCCPSHAWNSVSSMRCEAGATAHRMWAHPISDLRQILILRQAGRTLPLKSRVYRACRVILVTAGKSPLQAIIQ